MKSQIEKRSVIIAGRRKTNLTDVAKANPGMQRVELDIEDPVNISTVARKLACTRFVFPTAVPTRRISSNTLGFACSQYSTSALASRYLLHRLPLSCNPMRAAMHRRSRPAQASIIR